MIIAGRTSVIIEGPIGPFLIPAEPPETKRICEGLSRLLWDGGEYDHPDLPIDGIKRVLDIGAGWGAFVAWTRKRWPNTEIDCYDPHALGCEFVHANDSAARIHNVAVTSKLSAKLHVNEDWGASSTHFNDGQGENVAVLDPKTLPPCDMLKIDAEGVELEILIAYPTLESTRIVAYEWHSPILRMECRAVCERRGMHCLVDRNGPWGDGNGVAIWVPNE